MRLMLAAHGFRWTNYWLCLFRAQMLMKIRLKGAQTGHSLLKKKADALQMRFRMILGKIIEVGINKNVTLYQ